MRSLLNGICLSPAKRALCRLQMASANVRLWTAGNTLFISCGAAEIRSIDWTALAAFGRYAIPGCPIPLQQRGQARKRIVAAYQDNLKSIYLDSQRFRLVSVSEFELGGPAKITLTGSDAMALIREVWRELFDEICALTHSFSIIRGFPFIGGSTIRCFGASFFNLLPSGLLFATLITLCTRPPTSGCMPHLKRTRSSSTRLKGAAPNPARSEASGGHTSRDFCLHAPVPVFFPFDGTACIQGCRSAASPSLAWSTPASMNWSGMLDLRHAASSFTKRCVTRLLPSAA